MHKTSIIATALLLSLPACAPMEATRGNIVDADRRAEISVGTSTRDDVFRAMGSPTTVSPFDNNIWYYMGQKTEKHGIFDTEVVDEKIVSVTFDDTGIVRDMKEMDNARVDVPLNSSQTPTYGNDVTVMQQLLGNLGKFNPQEAPER